MKKFTSLLISCSLALAGVAMAQQPDQQSTPKEKPAAGKTHAVEAKPGANAVKPEGTAAKQHGPANTPAASKALKTETTPKPATSARTATKVSGEPSATATPGGKEQAQERSKGM